MSISKSTKDINALKSIQKVRVKFKDHKTKVVPIARVQYSEDFTQTK